ncbi:uncharacterized protein BXZ73DRAFT_73106 [Epithele typhae]|uniref:uncharacterized protein n=1 Tax=Epithele typhae TaxID=378194 RepID=UPI0020079014|nr:uncharacterized protein BXZ73DRAFT_73106 [Epithele typhae]KAH9946323.1 hypothetical protein BXZ73DRAFT_73106 [Epithele typhae]
MAATLTFVAPAPFADPLAPPPSQDFQNAPSNGVPNVFVIPPEEEHQYNPPFLFFDATEARRTSLSTLPDPDALHAQLGLFQQTDNRSPSFGRGRGKGLNFSFLNGSQDTVVMPRRAPSLVKLADMHMDVDEEALEAEDGLPDIRSRRRGGGAVGGTGKMKKSITFRARASQALRSIKLNVGGGKAAARRETVSEQVSPSAASPTIQATTLPLRGTFEDVARSPAEPASSTKSPTISRRRSVTLSQLFTSFKENQGARPETPSDDPMSPTSPTLVNSESSSIRPVSPTESLASNARCLHTSPSFEDYDRTPTRPSTLGARSLNVLNVDESAKPTLSKRKSFRRRLSVLELQKLFRSSGSNPNVAPPQDGADDVFSPSRPRSRSVDILSTSSTRSTSLSMGELASRPLNASRVNSPAADEPEDDDDDDLEMRLDSLHFDSLHFDPEEIMSSV